MEYRDELRKGETKGKKEKMGAWQTIIVDAPATAP